jgi:FkbM family methyltransferase
MRDIHTFDNGITVYKDHITAEQLRRYAINNIHEPDEEGVFVEAVSSLEENSVYVSVGTAVGYYAILAARLRPDLRIVCFEPLPRHASCLRENWLLNGLEEGRLQVFPQAISTNNEPTTLIDTSFGSSLAKSSKNTPLLRRAKSWVESLCRRRTEAQRLTVPCITLRDAFDSIGASVLGLVQMDIQGHEQAVLESYFGDKTNGGRNRIERFLIGTHGAAIHSACKQMLRENGYRMLLDNEESHSQPDGVLFATFL